MVIKLKRAIYGKASTPEDMREYTIEGSGSSAVGTAKEIKAMFPGETFVISDHTLGHQNKSDRWVHREPRWGLKVKSFVRRTK